MGGRGLARSSPRGLPEQPHAATSRDEGQEDGDRGADGGPGGTRLTYCAVMRPVMFGWTVQTNV